MNSNTNNIKENENSHLKENIDDKMMDAVGCTLNSIQDSVERMTENILKKRKLDTMASRIEQLEGCVTDLMETANKFKNLKNDKNIENNDKFEKINADDINDK